MGVGKKGEGSWVSDVGEKKNSPPRKVSEKYAEEPRSPTALEAEEFMASTEEYEDSEEDHGGDFNDSEEEEEEEEERFCT